MWIVKNPEWFDVIVTDNMFGDIITDLGAMIQGGMGVAAGGNINPKASSMFEPIGGSAPKYTGQGVINPIAAICAGQMMLDFLGETEAAQAHRKSRDQGHARKDQEPRRRQDGLQHVRSRRPRRRGPLGSGMKELRADIPGFTQLSPTFTRGRVFALVIGYFLLQALFRALVSDSVELDESEQVLCAQVWQWGYASDPPLYAWLQTLAFSILGRGVIGLALFKNSLLFAAFAFTYLATREIVDDERVPLVAMLSMFLFPQITWESQRDLTHSVLATALSAATFYVALRLIKSRRPGWYALLGLCVGFGTLSKYNYCIFAFGLSAAALSLPDLRRALLNRWTLLTVALWIIITLPYFRWVLEYPEIAFRRSSEVIKSSQHGLVVGRVLGVASLMRGGLTLLGVLTIVHVISFGTAATTRPSGSVAQMERWIVRTIMVAVVVFLVLVLVLGIQLKDRWLQPMVFLAAIAASLFSWNRLTPARSARFLVLVIALAATALVVLPAIPLLASITHRPTRLNAPYKALAEQLQAAAPRPGMIMAGTRLVGGNLKLYYPASAVIAPEVSSLRLPAHPPFLVVWDATKNPAPPERLTTMVAKSTGMDITKLSSSVVEASFSTPGHR